MSGLVGSPEDRFSHNEAHINPASMDPINVVKGLHCLEIIPLQFFTMFKIVILKFVILTRSTIPRFDLSHLML